MLAAYAKEHVEANATTFLGLTMGCCACHDHKFDPISQKEFYAFSAFFRNTTQPALGSRKGIDPPFIRVPAPEDRARWAALPGEQAAAQHAMDDYEAAFAANSKDRFPAILHDLAASRPEKPVSAEGLVLQLPLHDGTGNQIISAANTSYALSGNPQWTGEGILGPAVPLDGSVYAELGNIGDFDTTDKFSFGCWIRISGTAQGAVFARMDRNDNYRGWDLYLDNGRPAPQFVNSLPRTALQVESAESLSPNTWQHLFVTYDGTGKLPGVKISWRSMECRRRQRRSRGHSTARIRTTAQLTLGRRGSGRAPRASPSEDLRIYHRVLSPNEVNALAGGETIQAMLRTPRAASIPPSSASPFITTCKRWTRNTPCCNARRPASRPSTTRSPIAARPQMVMDEKPTPPFAFLLKRGQYDQKGEKLSPGVPKVLPPMPRHPRQPARPGKVARGPGNPLLADVTVNRFWQQLFGIGIVRTAEDFGVMGERPAMSSCSIGWPSNSANPAGTVKHMFKLMVMSAAYRQSPPVHPGEARCRSREPPHLARSALPARCRSHSGSGARGKRPAQPANRRPKRQALPAARPLGSGQHVQRSL